MGFGHRLADVDQLGAVGRDVEAVEPLQGLRDFVGVKASGTEFAAQLIQLGALFTAPVVFVDIHENFKHADQYNRISQRDKPNVWLFFLGAYPDR